MIITYRFNSLFEFKHTIKLWKQVRCFCRIFKSSFHKLASLSLCTFYIFFLLFITWSTGFVWFLDGEVFCWRADFRYSWGSMVSENCLLERLRGGEEGVEILWGWLVEHLYFIAWSCLIFNIITFTITYSRVVLKASFETVSKSKSQIVAG